MKKTSLHPAKHSKGSALLLVLALLVLLTTLTVAFLSRSTLERQLSNASFSQGKVDLAGQGAVASIITDLQQEILAGSNGTGTPAVATGLYYPTSNLTAVPAIVGFTSTGAGAVGMENLLKISKNSSAFYSGANYNTTTYPAPNRAAAVSTLTASLNNRSISNVRWNKPLLLAPTSGTDFTPVSANFVAPDWIYVARDGSNATTWDFQYQYLPSIPPTKAIGTTPGANPVTQRYAYAIYDEGGTLDMNVAGSPITSSSSVTYSANQPYKNALAYADLTQLPGILGLSATQKIAFSNVIVGWRNFASAGLDQTNVFPNTYTFSGLNVTAFDANIISNTSGFLGVGGTSLYNGPNFTGSQNQTDNAFASRQQLLQFFLQGLGQNTTFTTSIPLSTLVNVLPYLGTFSRGLSQPSYQPPPLSSVTGTTASPYATSSTGRPAVLPAANGGNNATGLNLDDKINSGFLSSSVMVTAAFTRSNGSQAVTGEPLVKKRFALSRLAWLTYKGPSSGRTMTDADMVALINAGIPQTYLLTGTAANIQKYFGLDWDGTNHRWLYDFHNSGGAPAALSTGAIMKLGDIAALGANAHDPDFFELLKASISVGSLGKALTSSNNVTNDSGQSGDTAFPPNFNYPFESSVDPQIIQIGANIIDQYQTAGYPVRIAFNNGALGNLLREYVSVENYPYFYAVQTGVLPALQPNLSASTPVDGIGVVTQWPIVWNPHDPNSSVGAGSGATATYPSQFRILADETDPDSLVAGTAVSHTLMCYSNSTPNSNATTGTGTSGSTLDTTFATYNPGTDTLGANSTYRLTSTSGANTSNSAITLSVSGNHSLMFHDPTVIMTAGPFTYGSSSFTASLVAPTDSVISTVTNGNGVTCVVANPTRSTFSTNQPANQRYLGFYLGAFPLAYMNKAATPAAVYPTSAYVATVNGSVNGTVVGTYITYRMQYQDAFNNWITYDTKYGCPLAAGVDSLHGGHSLGWGATGSSPGTAPDAPVGDLVWCYTSTTSDPRTHRFGMYTHFDENNGGFHTYGNSGYPQCFTGQENGGAYVVNGTTYSTSLVPGVFETAWLNLSNNVIAPFRQDMEPGSYFEGPYIPTSASGWNVGNPSGITFNHPGMLSQNCSQAIYSGARFVTDGQNGGPNGAADYYGDPDGVVRRADGGYVPPGGNASPVVAGVVSGSGEYGSADTTMGLPMTQVGGWGGGMPAPSSGIPTQINNSSSGQTAGQTSAFALNPPTGSPAVPTQNISRPYILHRPFRSVGEIGYAFRDTPWKSICFDKPESADSALLDVFTLNENYNTNGLEAGKIDLNTRQPYVLAALMANADLDDYETSGTTSTAATAVIGGQAALALANGIVARTTDTATTDVTNGAGPFQNISELVGKWGNLALTATPLVHSTSPQATPATGPANSSGFIDGMNAYKGFSGMPTPAVGNVSQTTFASSSTSPTNLMSLYTATSTASTFGVFPTTSAPIHAGLPEAMAYAKRYHEAPIRALVNGTQTRVWNLMIDVIAQTGRFPSSSGSLANFNVEGERRYWVHVAIDRYTEKFSIGKWRKSKNENISSHSRISPHLWPSLRAGSFGISCQRLAVTTLVE